MLTNVENQEGQVPVSINGTSSYLMLFFCDQRNGDQCGIALVPPGQMGGYS